MSFKEQVSTQYEKYDDRCANEREKHDIEDVTSRAVITAEKFRHFTVQVSVRISFLFSVRRLSL